MAINARTASERKRDKIVTDEPPLAGRDGRCARRKAYKSPPPAAKGDAALPRLPRQ